MLGWVPGYDRAWLRWDLLAGVTVTAYLVPQVMAYAELAGLPPETGLWAAIGALTVYVVLGSSRILSVGPESTTALMTGAAVGAVAGGPERVASFAVALALVVGGLCVLGYFLGLDRVSAMLSRPVLIGYMAGVAVIMIVSQLSKLTGIPVEDDGVVRQVAYVLRHLDEVHGPTLALGAALTVAMLVGSRLWPQAPVALAGMLVGAAVVAWGGLDDNGVRVVGEIPSAFPTFGLPDVTLRGVVDMLLPALGVTVVAYSDNILTARAFEEPGERIHADRELLALGVANVGSAVMQGFPVSSSGSRTAIARAVGGRTQLAAGFTVLVTVAALVVARPVLEAFPTAALGAVVVYAATRLVEPSEFVRFWRFRRSELWIALGTTAAVLVLGILQGILVAIALSLFDLLVRVTHPHDAVLGFVPGMAGMHDVDDWPGAQTMPGLMVYRYDSPLFFANADDFVRRVLATVDAAPEPLRWFVLNAEANVEVDITAVDALDEIRGELERRGVVLALARAKQDLLQDLTPSGFLDRMGRDRIFPTLPTAVAAYCDAHGLPHPGPPDPPMLGR